MPRLLVVHHTSSPSMHAMLTAVLDGAADPEIVGVEVVARAALEASSVDVLAADGYVLGTPANIGYMSGALKHFFDQIYYPCLESTQGRPYSLYVHGNDDTAGAEQSVQVVARGLRWRLAQPPLSVVAAPDRGDIEACKELGATAAALLELDS